MGGFRLFVTVLICLSTWLTVGVRGLDLASRELTVADIPACGINCLLLKIPKSACTFEDTECQCQNEDLKRALSACMLANCTMAESLDTSKVQAELCHFSDESKTQEVILYTGIVYSIAFLFVVFRIVGKIMSKRIALDDYIVVCAILITAIPLGCVLKMAGMGFGEHLWNLQHGQLRENLLLFLVAWSTYIVVLALIKVSLVMFYLEIFPSRTFRITAWVFLVYLIVNTLVLYLLTLFNCVPLRAFWNRDVKGRCMDINSLAYAASGCAIAQDVMLLILPLVFIRKLNMKLYRKIAVGLMFSIGTFGCIASILRLRALLLFKASLDPTWDYVPITVWTELELAAAFACVSLPSIRILFMMVVPQRVKEFLSNVSHHSRSAPTPNQNTDQSSQSKRQENKRQSWNPISQDIGGSLGTGIWSTDSRSQLRNSSRRLPSASGLDPHDLEQGSGRNGSSAEKPENLELQEVRSKSKSPSARQFCKSCCGQPEDITALPRVECPGDTSSTLSDRVWEPRSKHSRWKGSGG